MHEEQYMIRILNTLVATALSLIFSSDFVRTDGCGTHLVENQIGVARQNSNDPRWKRILASFSHASLRKKLASKHNISLYVPGRINDGGVKVDEQSEKNDSETLISKLDDWLVSDIIQLLHGICIPGSAD